MVVYYLPTIFNQLHLYHRLMVHHISHNAFYYIMGTGPSYNYRNR